MSEYPTLTEEDLEKFFEEEGQMEEPKPIDIKRIEAKQLRFLRKAKHFNNAIFDYIQEAKEPLVEKFQDFEARVDEVNDILEDFEKKFGCLMIDLSDITSNFRKLKEINEHIKKWLERID